MSKKSETPESDGIPKAVKEAFAKRFPGVKDQEWDAETIYEAEFELDGREVEVNFDEDGEILQIETEIEPEELPAQILAAIRSEYPHCEIAEAEKVELADGTIRYEVDLSFEVHFTPDGKIAAMGSAL